MPEFCKKIGVFIALIFGLGFGYLIIRTNTDPETGREIGQALSVLPFSGATLSLLQWILPLDSAMLAIGDSKPFVVSLLILLVQTVIQSPLMLLLNNTMGPVLFRTNANEYSVVGDPSASRAKDKILRRLGKLLIVCIVVPLIAFFAGYLLQMAFDWVNARPLPLTILIYVLAFAAVIGVALIPVFFLVPLLRYWRGAAHCVCSYHQHCHHRCGGGAFFRYIGMAFHGGAARPVRLDDYIFRHRWIPCTSPGPFHAMVTDRMLSIKPR